MPPRSRAGIAPQKSTRPVTSSPQELGQPPSLAAARELARPDEWALNMALKVDGRHFSLEGREYVRQVIRDTSDEIIIPKAAQMAFTITFLTRSSALDRTTALASPVPAAAENRRNSIRPEPNRPDHRVQRRIEVEICIR